MRYPLPWIASAMPAIIWGCPCFLVLSMAGLTRLCLPEGG